MIYDNLGVAEQGKVMTEGGLTRAQFNAQRGDMFLALAKRADDLEAFRIAEVAEQDRRPMEITHLHLGQRFLTGK